MNLPDNILNSHGVALGKTGSGKSSVLRSLAERMLDQKKRVCIIDPKGDWWGLKSSADGKNPGYPVVIFGGDHADVPLNPHAGPSVAELVATGNRPCIIDLGGWMVSDRTRFFIDFASTLFRLTRSPMWLIIDEVHNFAPQGKIQDPQAGKMLHWANRLASEGRGKGITIFSASQRPQKVHKDFITCAETLIAMRVIHNLDRDAIKNWIDGAPDKAKGKQVLDELASMPRGEAWVWSPETGFGPERVKFKLFKTYDSFAAPTSDRSKALRGWASVDLDEIRNKLSAAIEEAKSNDPKELKRQLAELQKQLKSARPAAPPPAKIETKTVDRFVLKDQHIEKLEQLVTRTESYVSVIKQIVSQFKNLPPKIIQRMGAEREIITKKVSEIPRTSQKTYQSGKENSELPKGEYAILKSIAWYPNGVTREQLTVLTGYKRSSRDAYLQRLKEKDLIETGSMILATPAGIEALGEIEPRPTGRELLEYHLQRLPEGERRILSAIVEAHPEQLTPDQLSEATEYKRSSRDAYLQRLQARQLISRIRGAIAASPELFD